MDIRIGIIWSSQVVELELDDHVKVEDVQKQIENAMEEETVLWLTDRKGKRHGVSGGNIAFVEIGGAEERKVGFGVH